MEEFLPASRQFSDDDSLPVMVKRTAPTPSDPYRAVYPERSGSERHVRVVSEAEVRSNWKWPESWERARKRAKPQTRQDPVKKAYAKRDS